jgi:outer membrane protein OmpA-like peptidoglycan-associated protein
MQRNTVYAVVAAVLLVVVALLVWQHLSRLSGQIAALSGQVTDLGARLDEAKGRAVQAEERAEQARRDAAEAATRAGEAAVQAEAATAREHQSAEEARVAKEARQKAQELARLAEAARDEADFRAREATAAREAEEQKRVEAERLHEEALAEAQTAREETRQARAEAEQIRRRLSHELDRLQAALGRIAGTRRTALGLVMTLDSSQIEFDFDKAEVRQENREILSRIAGVLLTFEDYSIQVFGHTDDVGSAEYNQELSERRAAAVRGVLVAAGIAPEVITTQGLGKSSPLVEGTDPESRQRNRRVELAIIFSEGEYETIQESAAAADGKT